MRDIVLNRSACNEGVSISEHLWSDSAALIVTKSLRFIIIRFVCRER